MKLGKDLRLGYADDQGRFTQFAWAQSCSYDKTTTFVKVSSPNTGGWEHVRPKTKGWVMQHEGLLGNPELVYEYDGQQYNFLDLISHFQDNNIAFEVRWLDVSKDGTVGELKRGTAYVKSHKEVASEKALAKVSVALQGTGPLEDLSANNLKGAFAYSISGTTLSLYALSRPVAGFNITIQNGDIISDTGQTWTPVGATLQTFTINALQPTSVIGGVKGDIVQHNLTFTDSTTLHVVLLQTTTRDEQQQPVRTVQALWWGGYAMGNMTLTKDGVSATMQTAGMQGSGEALTPFPFDILTGDVALTMTGTGQTLHCIDRTSSTQRTIGAMQTTLNTDGGDPYTGAVSVWPQTFGCDLTVWGHDADGNEVMRVTVARGASWVNTNYTALIPDAQHLHFRLEGLGTDEGGPYTIARTLIYDLETHDVYYAYDAATQTMRIFAPDQRFATALILDGTVAYSGNFYTTDAQGNRQPATLTGIASFSTISTSRGTYRFHDVSTVRMFNLSNTITIDKMPLYDVILTGVGGTQVGTLPALSSPNRTYPTYELVDVPGSVITGAEMPTGAVQTLSYTSYFQTVIVKTTATYNATAGTWSVTASLRGNSDGSGGAAVLPARLDLRWSRNAAVRIAAGKSGVTVSGLTYNPAWITPTATLISTDADNFYILTAPTPDVTEAHWTAYKIGLVGGYYCYDIAYLGGTHPKLSLTSGNFMFTPTVVKSGEQVADTLYRLSSISVDSVSINAKASGASDWSAATVEHVNVNTTDKLVLSYQLRDISAGVTVTELTNIDTMSSSVPVYSRKSNIASVLPRVGVVWHQSTVVYADKSLEPLTPGKVSGEEFRVEALAGVYSGDDSASGITARFTDTRNNVIDASGVTGVEVRAVKRGATIFPRS